MKPAWDELMKEYEGTSHSRVYDVDCTADGKELCADVGVQGYPTVKFGDPTDKNNLQDYTGGREAKDLKEWAAANLGPSCSTDTLDACSDKDREKLVHFLTQSEAELLAQIQEAKKVYSKEQKKVAKVSAKYKERKKEWNDDRDERRGRTAKKGKEKEFEAQQEKMRERKRKLDDEEKALQELSDALGSKKVLINLLEMAAKAKKDKVEL